jgi:Holliday junction resolvase-like predicted endonuclease
MSTAEQEITAPGAPEADQDAKSKSEKMPFTAGQYVAAPDGFISFNLRFPVAALELDPQWRPVEGILGLAEKIGLKGYGEGDVPLATIGVERATLNKDGGKLPNPNAGRPTGTINLVLHTDETLAKARVRGRSGMSDTAKKAATSASNLIKSVLSLPGNDAKVQEIADLAAKGEIPTGEALQRIAALLA